MSSLRATPKPLIPETMTAVSVLALALAVGACGGSSSTGTAAAAAPMLVCGEGTVEMNGECVPAPAPVGPGLTAQGMALADEIGTGTDPSALPEMLLDAMGMPMAGSRLEMSMDAVHDITDWSGSAYERMNAADASTTPATRASTDLVVVYNNIEPDEMMAYSQVYAQTNNSAVEGITSISADGEVTFDVNGGMIAAETASLIESSAFPTEADTSMAFRDDETTADTNEANSIAGMFHGVSGTYGCGANANGTCTVSRGTEGELILGTDTWTFTPEEADEDSPHMVAVADDDFLHFGYWMNASMNAAGEPVYDVSGISGGTMAIPYVTSGDVTGVWDLEGMATYSGSATGIYLRKVVDPNSVEPTDLYHGQFTADVKLTTYFGGDDVAVSKHDSVKGMITGFMDGNDPIDSTWSVTLKSASFGDPNDIDSDTGMFSAATEGDTDLMDMWSGRFYGAVTDDDASTSNEDETVYPSGIAGTFDSHFTNGHVRGGFGAAMDEE